jgi:hypothetical protein
MVPSRLASGLNQPRGKNKELRGGAGLGIPLGSTRDVKQQGAIINYQQAFLNKPEGKAVCQEDVRNVAPKQGAQCADSL